MTMTPPTTETGIVEKVARAIDPEAWDAITDGRDVPGTLWDVRRDIARHKARAAIAAMPDQPVDEPQLTDEETAELVERINDNPNLHPLPDSTQLLQTMAERDALKHDVERQMTIANIECNEAERLRQLLQTMAGALGDARTTLLKTATGRIGSDDLTIPRQFFNSVIRNLDAALAQFRAQEQRS